jgi:hypothetical protein
MTAHVYKYELVFINIKNISTFLSEHIPLFHMLPQISRVFTVIHTIFTYVHRRHVHKACVVSYLIKAQSQQPQIEENDNTLTRTFLESNLQM